MPGAKGLNGGEMVRQDGSRNREEREQMGSRMDKVFRGKAKKCWGSFDTESGLCPRVGVISNEGLLARFLFLLPLSFSQCYIIIVFYGEKLCLSIAKMSQKIWDERIETMATICRAPTMYHTPNKTLHPHLS